MDDTINSDIVVEKELKVSSGNSRIGIMGEQSGYLVSGEQI